MNEAEEFLLADAGGAALVDTSTITAITAAGPAATNLFVPGGIVKVQGSYVDTRTRLKLGSAPDIAS